MKLNRNFKKMKRHVYQTLAVAEEIDSQFVNTKPVKVNNELYVVMREHFARAFDRPGQKDLMSSRIHKLEVGKKQSEEEGPASTRRQLHKSQAVLTRGREYTFSQETETMPELPVNLPL
jgi:hypothetical protein